MQPRAYVILMIQRAVAGPRISRSPGPASWMKRSTAAIATITPAKLASMGTG